MLYNIFQTNFFLCSHIKASGLLFLLVISYIKNDNFSSVLVHWIKYAVIE